MKKLICLLSFILIFSCLVACNGSEDFSPQGNVNVTLDLDGGEIDGKTSYLVRLWEDFDIPTPRKKGHDFKGWTHNGSFVTFKPWMINEKSVTIKANWQKRSYEVYFDFNGGVLYKDGVEILQKQSTVIFGDKVEIETPQKFGYNFAGWYYGEQKVDLNSFDLDVGKVIVKAKWELKKQTIAFNFNGGKQVGNPSITKKVIDINHEEDIPFPTLEKKGYTFGGWAYKDGSAFNLKVWQYNESVSELFAVWNPIKVVYELDLKGGTLGKTSGEILYGTSAQSIKNLIPEKEGYDFTNWTIDGSKLGFKFNYLPINGNSKVIITAQYTPKTYYLTLDVGEGSFSEGVSTTVPVEFGVKKVIQTPIAPINKYFVGYKIEGTDEYVCSASGNVVWGKTYNAKLIAEYSSEKYVNFINYDGTIYSISLEELRNLEGSDLPQPKTIEGYSASWELGFYDIVDMEEPVEVNAILTPRSCSVLFKNGHRLITTRTFTYGKEVNLPSGDDVVNEGYNLLGWSLSSTDNSDYMSGTVVWKFASRVELFAVWTNFEYKITYDTSSIQTDFNLIDESGSLATSVQTVTYQKPYKLYELSAKNNSISVTWLYNGKPFAISGNYELESDIVLTPKITYNSINVDINLDLNGGIGSTVASVTLNSQFKTMTPAPSPPKNKSIVAYSYKGQIYLPTDIFKITNYDGTPIKVIYEDYIYFRINVDVNGGTGDNFAIIEYGKALGTMNARPVAPNGKKLVGFEYNRKTYSTSYIWDFDSYDGGVFKAIYVDDDLDWSPTV